MYLIRDVTLAFFFWTSDFGWSFIDYRLYESNVGKLGILVSQGSPLVLGYVFNERIPE